MPKAQSTASHTVAALLTRACQDLAAVCETPRLDAELLLAQALQRPRSHLHAWPDKDVDDRQRMVFEQLLARRAQGEPLAYISGRREFWSLDLAVDRHTLIPRPETECLVEQALRRLPVDQARRVADLGTGSGAIALALAVERPQARVVATDRSAAALACARANARRLAPGRIEFIQTDWCAALATAAFDLLVANPPYVAQDDPHLADLHYEPATALVAGPEGLDALRHLARHAGRCLRPGGQLLLEHGDQQGTAVRQLLHAAGWIDVFTAPDPAGRDRVSGARKVTLDTV